MNSAKLSLAVFAVEQTAQNMIVSNLSVNQTHIKEKYPLDFIRGYFKDNFDQELNFTGTLKTVSFYSDLINKNFDTPDLTQWFCNLFSSQTINHKNVTNDITNIINNQCLLENKQFEITFSKGIFTMRYLYKEDIESRNKKLQLKTKINNFH
jgi:hypothetical protein